MARKLTALLVLFFFIATSNYGWAQSDPYKEEPYSLGITLPEVQVWQPGITDDEFYLDQTIEYILDVKNEAGEAELEQRYNNDMASLKDFLAELQNINNKIDEDKSLKAASQILNNDSELNVGLSKYLLDLTQFLASKIIKAKTKKEYEDSKRSKEASRYFNRLANMQTTIINYLYWRETLDRYKYQETKNVAISYLYSNLLFIGKPSKVVPTYQSILIRAVSAEKGGLKELLNEHHSKSIALSKEDVHPIRQIYYDSYINALKTNIKNFIYTSYKYGLGHEFDELDAENIIIYCGGDKYCSTELKEAVNKYRVEVTGNILFNIEKELRPKRIRKEQNTAGSDHFLRMQKEHESTAPIRSNGLSKEDSLKQSKIVNEFDEYASKVNQLVETFNAQLKNTKYKDNYLESKNFRLVSEYSDALKDFFSSEDGTQLIKDYYTALNKLSEAYPISRFIMANEDLAKEFYQDPVRRSEELANTYIEKMPSRAIVTEEVMNRGPDYLKANEGLLNKVSYYNYDTNTWRFIVENYLKQILDYTQTIAEARSEYEEFDGTNGQISGKALLNTARILKVQPSAVMQAFQYDGEFLNRIDSLQHFDRAIEVISSQERQREDLRRELGVVGVFAGGVMILTGVLSWLGSGLIGASTVALTGMNIVAALTVTGVVYYEFTILEEKKEDLSKKILAEDLDLERLMELSIDIQDLRFSTTITALSLPLDLLMVPQIVGFLRSLKSPAIWKTTASLLKSKKFARSAKLEKSMPKSSSTKLLSYMLGGGLDTESIIKLSKEGKLLKDNELLAILEKDLHSENTASVIDLLYEKGYIQELPSPYKISRETRSIKEQLAGKKDIKGQADTRSFVKESFVDPFTGTPYTGTKLINPYIDIPKNQAEYEKALSLLPDEYLAKQTLRERTLRALWSSYKAEDIKLASVIKNDYVKEASYKLIEANSTKLKEEVKDLKEPGEFFEAVEKYHEGGKSWVQTYIDDVKHFYIEKGSKYFEFKSQSGKKTQQIDIYGRLNGGKSRKLGTTTFLVYDDHIELYWMNIRPEARGLDLGTEMIQEILSKNNTINKLTTSSFAYSNEDSFMRKIVELLGGNHKADDIFEAYKGYGKTGSPQETLATMANRSNDTRRYKGQEELNLNSYDIRPDSKDKIDQIIVKALDSTPLAKSIKKANKDFELDFATVNLYPDPYTEELPMVIKVQFIKKP